MYMGQLPNPLLSTRTRLSVVLGQVVGSVYASIELISQQRQKCPYYSRNIPWDTVLGLVSHPYIHVPTCKIKVY